MAAPSTTALKNALLTHPVGAQWRSQLPALIDLCLSHAIDTNCADDLGTDKLLIGSLDDERVLLLHDNTLTVLHTVWVLSRTHRDANNNPIIRRYLADTSGLKILPSGEYNAQFMYHCICAEYGIYRERMATIQANQHDTPSDAYVFSSHSSASGYQWLVA